MASSFDGSSLDQLAEQKLHFAEKCLRELVFLHSKKSQTGLKV
ncbi:771_t:CDS:1, partial [Dentiscutata erythropus]